MGNRMFASFYAQAAFVAVFCLLIVPLFTHASSRNRDPHQMMIDRLCAVQERLGDRLPHPIINPALCDSTPTPEPTLTFNANPTSITQGANSTLTWSTTNATSCNASNGWSGAKALSGSEVVSPLATTTYALTCNGAGGSVAKSVTINVTPTPTPQPTVTITADPMSVTPGAGTATTTLTWSSTNATSCMTGGGSPRPLSGSDIVTPVATTTYQIMCTGPGGEASDDVTVNFIPASEPQPNKPTLTFAANPTSLQEGSAGNATSTLTWDSTNATSCTASNGWSGAQSLDGTTIVQPTGTTSITYTLTCTGAGGSIAKSVTLSVVPPVIAQPSLTLSANPLNVTPGVGSATSTLTWSSSNATTCVASGGWTGNKNLSGSEIVQPVATTTYTLDCGNGTATSSQNVTVNFVPQVQPPPSGALLITELIYDLGTGQGSEPGNEWVELYNGTNSAIDLSGYYIHDASSSDPLPSGILNAGQFAVIVASSTTAGIWNFPAGALVLQLANTTIGNGLGNTSDYVWLESNASTTVDAVSWGGNVSAFNPSVVDVAAGNSIARSNILVDTNSAADWIDRASPTPGQ